MVSIDKMERKKEQQRLLKQQQRDSLNLQKSAREIKELTLQTALNSKLMNNLTKKINASEMKKEKKVIMR